MVQEEHGDDVKLLVVYLYSDETRVTSFGEAAAYPMHMSIGNFTRETRQQKGGSRFLVAYLPVLRAMKATRKSAYVTRRGNEVRQLALKHVLEPLRKAMAAPITVKCPDGVQR